MSIQEWVALTLFHHCTMLCVNDLQMKHFRINVLTAKKVSLRQSNLSSMSSWLVDTYNCGYESSTVKNSQIHKSMASG